MADNTNITVDNIATDELTEVNGDAQGAPLPKAQRVRPGFGPDGVFQDVDTDHPFPVVDPAVVEALATLVAATDGLEGSVDGIEGALATLNGKDFATQTTVAAILAKLIAAPATEAKQDTQKTVLDSILAKLIVAPSTAANQASIATKLDTLISNTDGLELSLTDIDLSTDGLENALAQIFTELGAKLEAGDVTGLATSAKQDLAKAVLDTIAAKDFATQTTSAAILAKLIAAPATEGKQDTANTLLTAIDGHVDGLEGALAALATESKLEAVRVLLAAIDGHVDGLEGFTDGIEGLLAAATPSGSNVIGRVGHDTTNGGSGSKAVAAAGTRVALATSTAAKWVVVTARSANTGKIAIGYGNVVAAAGTEVGAVLAAGDAITLLCDDLNEINVDSTVNGEGVSFTYGT